MKWDSPWGPSYPGWHIECSTMSQKHLGEQFDIHTGGVDLIPTHHENEIAQSKGCTGKIPARFWMHGEFLLINGGKMSKSLGNVYLLKDIVEKGYDPLVYKYFCYTAHYRNKLNFTWEAIDASNKSLMKLRESYRKHLDGEENIEDDIVSDYKNRFIKAINDDLNMPLAMGVVWEVAKNEKKSKKFAELLLDFDRVLGLKIDKKDDIPEEVLKLLEERNNARKEKDWKKSDELRDKIQEYGYRIEDTKDGTNIERIK